jgi:hypothetical protein
MAKSILFDKEKYSILEANLRPELSESILSRFAQGDFDGILLNPESSLLMVKGRSAQFVADGSMAVAAAVLGNGGGPAGNSVEWARPDRMRLAALGIRHPATSIGWRRIGETCTKGIRKTDPRSNAARGTLQRSEMVGIAFERHYRVRELAGLWRLSAKTVTRMFAEETGVIRIANEETGKRKYATLSIPESVALRVHERLGNQTFQATLAGGHPLRIIRLSDFNAGMSKKPRNVLKRDALQ